MSAGGARHVLTYLGAAGYATMYSYKHTQFSGTDLHGVNPAQQFAVLLQGLWALGFRL